ncbi:MAG: GMC family oxidoreductase N-terminal domain-containing protein [Hyphomonadaceae bacterium]|nr:GMC family oxidoreductase N-terminal domain-containing protein [Hyphomonadaceae bacterium]
MNFDYVIVGGGSAGAVLAARLSANPNVRVLLLEGGGPGRHPMFRIPLGFFAAMQSTVHAWQFATEPEEQLGGRSIRLPRGRVIGGSSAINGLVYVRGNRTDFDEWRQKGCVGWGYDDVLPLFKRSEHFSGGADRWRGGTGKLRVTDPTRLNPLSEVFLEAAQAAGLPRALDYNGESQDGVAYFQLTTANGVRSSAADFLRAARSRPNLRIETGAVAERVLFQQGRANGVRYVQDKLQHVAHARAEVILCAGAFGSPHILMHSGIGDGEQCAAHGIEVLVHSPHVGKHLADHFSASVAAYVTARGWSLNERIKGMNLAREVALYALMRRGLLASSAAHVTAFCRTQAASVSPDLQLMMLPAGASGDKTGPLDPRPGITVGCLALKPQSRGDVTLRSPNPAAPPRIRMNYLTAERDKRITIDGLRLARKILSAPPLQGVIEQEYIPGASAQTDDELLDHALSSGNTAHHPVGTCRMGAANEGVVDAALKVHGVSGLRVADASIMPSIVSGNTNAACVMIGEKAADLISSSWA